MDLEGKHLVLGLSGGIACYKAAELCRLLTKAGATVQVVMTKAAERFITPVTMQALSGRPVFGSQWDARQANAMPHIDLAREADAIVVAPASADFIAQLVAGRAGELLPLLCLARPRESVPLLLAPAMNREMWSHPATLRNLQQVAADGAVVLGVGSGAQACGETGDGRMLEAAELADDIVAHFQPKHLQGKRVLVTAGPTFEAIDPIRGITNHSSGKMGFAIARAAREAGAHVTLIAGPVHLPTPRGVARVDVQSAAQMHAATLAAAQQADLFVATAAVADWRPASPATHKIKKQPGEGPPVLHFEENADILADVARLPRAQRGELFCIGFAAESHDLVNHAQAKRLKKGIPLLVGNIGPLAFGSEDNELLLVDAQGSTSLPRAPKLQLARELIAAAELRMRPAGLFGT